MTYLGNSTSPDNANENKNHADGCAAFLVQLQDMRQQRRAQGIDAGFGLRWSLGSGRCQSSEVRGRRWPMVVDRQGTWYVTFKHAGGVHGDGVHRMAQDDKVDPTNSAILLA
jgi:hypothetical protein